MKAGLSLLIAVSLSFCGTSAVFADAYFDQGVSLYQKRDFKNAAQYFAQAVRNSPWDSNAPYYLALSYHQMGDLARAKEAYKDVVKNFPGGAAAQNAMAALKVLDPSYGRSAAPAASNKASSGSGGSSATSSDPSDADLASLPEQTRIYYQTGAGGMQVVDAQINGRAVKMVLDTGAGAVVIGKNQLQQLSLPVPQGSPAGTVAGSTAAGTTKFWTMPVELRVGGIVRKNFPIQVLEKNEVEPLLGQTFLRGFEYTIDNGARCLLLKRKSLTASSSSASSGRTSASAAADRYAVPFQWDPAAPDKMLVSVEVNGRAYPMWFDTGNSASAITFYERDVKALNLRIPDDSPVTTSSGITGTGQSKNFTLHRVKLGPIDVSGVEAKVNLDERDENGRVTRSSGNWKPLVGQGLYAGWQYTIDNDRKLIKFVRR